MKKLFYLISIFITLFAINCVAFNKANAEEPTWYEEAAAEVGNPIILEDDQYFEGVSINSHIISDLTFLQIPFAKYISSYNSEKQMQIIAFTEALYMEDDEIQNEVVMYLYVPKEITNVDSVQTKMNLLKQEILQEDGKMVEEYCSPLPNYHNWSKVSSYDRIVKFSFGTYKTNASAKDILLKQYNKKQTHTLVSTEFDVKINLISNGSGITENYDNLVSYGMLMLNQEFNFIYEKNNEHARAYSLLSDEAQEKASKQHFTTSIGYNETTAKVDGALYRLRVDQNFTDEVCWAFRHAVFDGMFGSNDSYADYFYYFFNVFDSDSGKKWTGNEVITKINYTYYEYLQEYKNDGYNILWLIGNNDRVSSVTYFNENGSVYAKDTAVMDVETYDFHMKYGDQGNIFDYYNYREPSTLKDIYQSKSVVPDTFECKYPIAKDSPSVLDYLFGTTKQKYIATMPTLFSTSDEKFVSSLDFNLADSVKSSDYQYAMWVGNKAYPATSSYSGSTIILASWGNWRTTQYDLEIISLDDIWYEYEGEQYHATVTETIVDKSHVNTPVNPFPGDGNDFFPSIEDPEKTWWEKIIEFFKNLFEWIAENYKVIIFVVCVVIVTIFVIRIAKEVKQYRANKIIIDNTKKKEEKRE